MGNIFAHTHKLLFIGPGMTKLRIGLVVLSILPLQGLALVLQGLDVRRSRRFRSAQTVGRPEPGQTSLDQGCRHMMNAGHIARTEHLGRKLLRNRLSQRFVVAECAPALCHQSGCWRPVGRKTNQIARDKTAGMRKGPALGIERNNQGSLNMVRSAGCLDSVGGEHLDAAALEMFCGIRSVRRPVARVHHRRDPDSGTEQLSGKRPARVIMTDHHRSCTGLHAIQVQQSPHTAAEHDSG